MTATNRAERYYVPVALAEAEVSLDAFSVEEIIDYLKHIGELPAHIHTGDPNEEPAHDIERLYYATRGDGPIAPAVADDVRALLRTLAGRA